MHSSGNGKRSIIRVRGSTSLKTRISETSRSEIARLRDHLNPDRTFPSCPQQAGTSRSGSRGLHSRSLSSRCAPGWGFTCSQAFGLRLLTPLFPLLGEHGPDSHYGRRHVGRTTTLSGSSRRRHRQEGAEPGDAKRCPGLTPGSLWGGGICAAPPPVPGYLLPT